MPRRGRGGFGIVHSHQAPKSFRSSDRWDIDEDFQQSNKMFFFSSASDPSFSPPSGYHNQSATEHRLLDHFKDVGRGSQSNDGLYYKAEQVLGISGHSSLVDMKYSRESHKVNSVRGMGFVREPPMMVQSDLDRHNPVGNLKSKKPKKVKNQALEQWGVDQGNSSRNCPTNGHGNGKRAASPNSFVCQLLEGIDDFHSLDQPSLVESGRSNSKSTTFASSVAAYQKSMRDMELAIVPQPSVFDRVNMSDLKHKRKIKQEPPDLARRPASKKSFAELEEGELAESGSTNDHSERNYVRRSRKSPEYREGSPITRHSAGHHRSMAMEKGDNGSRRDVRIVRYTSYSPVISVKKEYHEVRRVRRYDGDGSKDRTDSRFFKCTPERSCSRSRSRSRSSDYARRGRRSSLPSPRRKSMRRSPSRSPRRGSPRRSPPRSPRRGSPRRSPRSSRRESPRRSPVRSPRRSLTRSPCRSPIRYPRRSPSCYSRRSSRRSPQHSTRRSPRRSSRHSPRNSPRRSSHTRRRRSSSRSSGRMHTTRSCSRSPERPKRRRTSRSSSRSRSSLSSITRSGSHQDDSQDFRGQSVQTNATSAVPKLINSLDYGPGSHPDSRTPFATPNVIVNPQIPFLPLGARISVIPEVTPMSFSVAPSAPQPSSIKSEIPAMPTGTDSASHRLMRGPPALIPVHAPVQRVSEQAEAEAREDEETKKRRYQRDEYQKKRDKLVHELFRLQTQQADSVTKHQLVNADKETKRLEVLIVENAKLQQVITNRVRMLDDLIAKHTSALQEDVDAARTMSQADYFYFDSQHHWCSVCDVVLPKMDAYLLHLHSSQHEINWMSQGVPSFPWHKLRLQDVNVCTAQSKRVPFHGLPFLQPVKAWFCRLCEVWIGDVNHAKVHLSSPEHNTAYLKYIVENPDWETNRSLKRQESLKRAAQQRKVTAEQKRIEEEAKKKQIDEENDKNWKIFVQHQATINSPTVELDEPGAPEPVGDYKSVKSIRLNVRSLAAKKDDPALDSSTPSALKDVAIGQEPRENENNAGAPPESQTPKKNEETEISAQKTVERDQSVDCSGSSLNTRETEAGARQRAPDDAGKSGDFVPLSKIKQEKPDVDDGPPPVMSSDINDPCPRLPSE